MIFKRVRTTTKKANDYKNNSLPGNDYKNNSLISAQCKI